MKPAFDLYQVVTDRVVAQLEQVLITGEKWTQPYVPAPQTQPLNVKGRPYRGMNWWLLALANAPSGCWATFRMWQAAGAQVRKGEKGTMVVFWKTGTGKKGRERTGDADADAKGRWMLLRHFTVFSAEQVDGFDLEAWTAKHREPVPQAAGAELHEAAEDAFMAYHRASGVKLVADASGLPRYNHVHDMVSMPPRQNFHSQAGLYSTWAHELVHSTGHKSRLEREFGKRFGDHAYAIEELVAELGAAMITAAVGVSTECREDHACYIAHWIGVLKQDKRAVFTIASKSQLAADLILQASEPDEEEQDEPEALAA